MTPPLGCGQYGPRSLIGRIYVGDPLIVLHTYVSCGPFGYREEGFSNYTSMEANDPRGVASLNPRGMVGRIYAGDYQTLLHTKSASSGPNGVREEHF